MNMIMSIETAVFFESVLLGAILGICFDVFRILRITIPSSKAAVFIQDILFFVIIAAASFYFFVTFNEGIVRGYLLLGELLGFIIYYCTIGSLVFKAAEWIISWLKRILGFVFRVVLWPFFKFFKLIKWLFQPFCKIIGDCAKKIKKTLRKPLLSKRVLLYNHIHNTDKHSGTPKKRKFKKWLRLGKGKNH